MNVFIPLVGQLTNVGDTLHRSVLIEWLKEDFKLHLYIGKADESFLSGLYIDESCVLYKSFFAWYFFSVLNVASSAFIYNPGEITGSFRRFMKEVLLWPMLVMYKIFGRSVLKVGVDVVENGKVKDLIYKITNAFTDFSFYRTTGSFSRFGSGEVIPDLGFYRYSKEGVSLSDSRNYVTISMRADRELLDKSFYSEVVDFVNSHGMKVALVSQVKADNESTDHLAKIFNDLGAHPEVVVWGERTSHRDQEKLVNSYYNNSLLTVSDRLHVLIASANNGAVPLCFASYFSNKIANHFGVIGYKGNVFDLKSSNIDVKRELENAVERREELADCLESSQRELENVRRKLFKYIAG